MFKEGQLVIYKNGYSYQIGKIKSVHNTYAFVYYHRGATANRTHLTQLAHIDNAEYINSTDLGVYDDNEI